jgi:hypothetical protein
MIIAYNILTILFYRMSETDLGKILFNSIKNKYSNT